jgi:predicted ArsR family transcriptional regulator
MRQELNRTAKPIAEAGTGADWLAAIADPVRLQIVLMLSQVGEATASELALRARASYQTLRRHLEALETHDVIQSRPANGNSRAPGRPAARFSLSPDVRESVCAVLRAPS